MKNIKLIIGLIALAIIIYGCTTRPSSKKFDKHQTAELTVTVSSPQQRTIKQYIEVTGNTASQQEVVVTTELSGVRILQLYSDVGDIVKRGQKLGLLDCDSLQSQLVEANNDYELKQDEYSRIRQLALKGIEPKAIAVQKRALMKSAQARLTHAQHTINHCDLITPEAGFIFERKAIIGELVSSNEVLYRIAGGGRVEVKASVPEDELTKLRLGQNVIIKIAGYPKKILGKIRLITPKVNPNSRTADVRISLENNSNLQIGLFSNASIQIGQISGQTLPSTALQRDHIGTYVWKLSDGNTVTRQPVIVLDYFKDMFVLQKIPENSKIVARAGVFVKKGDIVNVVDVTRI